MADKGLIVETGDGWAIILLSSGEFKKIRSKGFLQVGDLHSPIPQVLLKYAVAAALFLAILFSTIDFFSVTAYARVSSGIELGLNRWDRVVYAKSIDEGGQEILQEVGIKGKKVGEALDVILKQSINSSKYTDQAQKITVYVEVKQDNYKKYQDRLTKEIDQAVQKTIAKENMNRIDDQILKVDQVLVKPSNKQNKSNETGQDKPDTPKSIKGNSESNNSDNNGNPKTFVPGDEKQAVNSNLENPEHKDLEGKKNKQEKIEKESDAKSQIPGQK